MNGRLIQKWAYTLRQSSSGMYTCPEICNDCSVFPIASRTIDSLIRTQGVGDLYQIYALCKRDGNDFNLAYIPSDFTDEPTEGFDPVYMRKLLDRGYQMALDGYPWEHAPPGFILEP